MLLKKMKIEHARFFIVVTLSIVGFVTSAHFVHAAPLQQVLPNPSFELGTTNWSGSAGDTALGTSFTTSTLQPLDGKYLGRLTANMQTGSMWIASQPFTVSGQQDVRGSFYFRSNMQNIRIVIQQRDSAGATIASTESTPNTPLIWAWNELTYAAILAPQTKTVQISVFGDVKTPGTQYLDLDKGTVYVGTQPIMTQLLTNTDFEQGTVGWGANGTDATSLKLSAVTFSPYSGTYHARLQATLNSGYMWMHSTVVPIKGTQLHGQLRVRSNLKNISVLVWQRNVYTQTISTTRSAYLTPTAWQWYTLQFDAPVAPGATGVYISVSGETTKPGTIHYLDIDQAELFGDTNTLPGVQAAASLALPADNGIRRHMVWSPRQGGMTQLRVLLPDNYTTAKNYPVLYVLPVEANEGVQFGDGLTEVKKTNIHNTAQTIVVAPTFANAPWYADHPSDTRIQQEKYMLADVVHFVDQMYSTTRDAASRRLLGFSKSGWGSYSLLMRNQHAFSKSVAWDAPLNKQAPDQWEMPLVFATQENFDRYKVTGLLQAHAPELDGVSERLYLSGYSLFKDQHTAVHDLMTSLSVTHNYSVGTQRAHLWGSGWVPNAVSWLVANP